MNLSFIKTATFTPKIKVADVDFNKNQIINAINESEKLGVDLLAFPELCISGYTCGDLYYADTLLEKSKTALVEIAKSTLGKDILVFVGLAVKYDGLIYNVCAGLSNGVILGLIPKTYLPNYNEFYEKRHFSPALDKPVYIRFKELGNNEEEQNVLLYKNIIFCDKNIESFKVSAEICEDLWAAIPPSLYHSVNGARLIVNLSASTENVGKIEERQSLVKSHSSKAVCGYIYANAGVGESTTDSVFSGHSIIAEHGEILSESKPFDNGFNIAEIDLDYIDFMRSKVFNYDFGIPEKQYVKVGFFSRADKTQTKRKYNQTPFIRIGEENLTIDMQAEGLKKRIEHTCSKKLILGLSGGLDSTLAVLVCARAMEKLNRPNSDILAVTMPCFGTTSRTLDNSVILAKALKVSLKKVDISKSVTRHLKDIGHDKTKLDAAFENAQARERTQVLMDIANMENGMVVGTGDLSEVALGWATYNGDHMSNYGVNASVPKTLVRHLTDYCRKQAKGKLKSVLADILDTPVSPELLPNKDGEITQRTEDIVGPYLLHDFFIYHIIKRGSTPEKLFVIAKNTFEGIFDEKTILKWLNSFYKRFFSQQFKRSCMPDGVKVTEISLSPRGGWRMPSDAVATAWLNELKNL